MAKYIEWETLLAHLRKCKETSTGSSLTAAVITAIQYFVEKMPAADVAPVVHGRWTDTGNEILDNIYAGWKCSLCGYIFCGDNTNFCPNCGAKMDGRGEEA